MKKLSPLIILSTLLLSGCGVFGGGGNNNQTNNTPTPPPQPTPEQTVTDDNKGGTKINNMPNGLKPSTNPKERLSQVTQGRDNPFASFTPPPLIKIPPNQTVPESTIATKAILREPLPLPSENTGNNVQSGAGKSGGRKLEDNNHNNLAFQSPNTATPKNFAVGSIANQGGNPQGAKLEIPKSVPPLDNSKNKIVPPALPEPKEAQSVIVSGIADVQGQNIAFITTPWDNVTRSVRVGDTLFSQDLGVTIRVRDIRFTYPKTIALKEDEQIVYRNLYEPNGVVVLEQYGQRVTREILGSAKTSTGSKG